MKIVWIFGDEAFEQRGNDVERANAVYDVRIEVLHFLAIAFVQNLQAIAVFDVRFRLVAGGLAEEKNEKPQMETDVHRLQKVVAALLSSAEPNQRRLVQAPLPLRIFFARAAFGFLLIPKAERLQK